MFRTFVTLPSFADILDELEDLSPLSAFDSRNLDVYVFFNVFQG